MFVIIVKYIYFTYISQGSDRSGERHLQYGEIYNNHVIANCLQSVPVKKNRLIINEDMDKSKVTRFFIGPFCIYTEKM